MPSANIKSSRFLTLAAICVVVAALFFARDVLIPIAMAVLLTFLLAPLVHAIERRHVPRVLAVLLIVAVCFGAVGGISWLVTNQATDLAGRLEDYRGEITARIDTVRSHFLTGTIAKASRQITQVAHEVAASQPGAIALQAATATGPRPIPVIVANPEEPSGRLLGILGNVLDYFAPIARTLVVIVLVMFMLMKTEDLRDRFIRLIGHAHLTVTTQALIDAGRRVSRYLLVQSVINGSYAIIVGVALSLLKIPNAPLWGLLSGILRFIPYLGIWISAAFPILLSIIVPGPFAVRPLLTVSLYLALELIVGNFLEPIAYGASVGVSTVAILVAAVFWTWLWGPVGLLLSTPLTVVLVVMGKYVPQMQFLSVMLGDEPVLAEYERYYQRMLADAPEEASTLLQEMAKTQPPLNVYRGLLLPALRLAEQDHVRGLVDERKRDLIRAAVSKEIEALRKRTSSDGAPSQAATAEIQTGQSRATILPKDCQITVVCVPAHSPSDEVAGMMFGHLLEQEGYRVQTISSETLASERLDLVERHQAHLVVISALPPAALSHARYLYKLLHKRFPNIGVLIGLWQSRVNLFEARRRIGFAPTVRISTDFSDAQRLIGQMIQPLLVQHQQNSPSSHTAAQPSPAPASASHPRH